MEVEIQKSVEAGKLTPAAAKSLQKLPAGTFCLHKSWGFGRVTDINFLLDQITIDFTAKKGHTMQLDYAAASLQAIPADHILARKSVDLAGVKAEAKNSPAALIRNILESYGGHATPDQIGNSLQPEVFNEAEWKRWWENTKKVLRKDGHFTLPAKRTEPVELRASAAAPTDGLLAQFHGARQLKQQITALEAIAKNATEFPHPAELAPVLAAAESAALKNLRLDPAHAFEMILARDEIREKVPALAAAPVNQTIADLIRDERRIGEIIGEMPAAKQKRMLGALPAAFGDEWPEKALALTHRGSIRMVGDIARLLQETGQGDLLRRHLERAISEHSASTEVLYWLCKERHGPLGDLLGPAVFSAILTALERDQFNDIKRGGKLRDLLSDDRELVTDLLATAEPEIVRDSMRKLLLTPVFEELNKRSLLGRIIRIHPELQSMLTGETAGEKQEALIVSWISLDKRKTDYEELITKKIPENTKEIALARSYGDLRENFEFKAAKEMQRVLMRRKAETELALANARGTNFENPDTSVVSIGTNVTLRELGGGQIESYSILGAWDSDPAHGIISYQAAIGQALLGHGLGEEIDLPTETGTRRVEIVSIESYTGALTGVPV